MTKEELAQKIKDSDYTCRGIKCCECISVNGFGCCLQADKKLFVSMFLSSQNQEYAELQKRIAELEEENRQLRNEVKDLRAYCEQIGKIKTGVLKLFEHIVAR